MIRCGSHIRSTAAKKELQFAACAHVLYALVLAPAATVVEICWRDSRVSESGLVSFIFTTLLLSLSLCAASEGCPSYIDKKEIVILEELFALVLCVKSQ